MMTDNVKMTREVVEEKKSSQRGFTTKNDDAFLAKPRTSSLGKIYNKHSPCETDARSLREGELRILKNKPKTTENVQNKTEKITTTTDVRKRPDDLPKTTKNLRKRMSKICSATEDVLLVERTAEPNQTNSSTSGKPSGSNSKTLRKNRIVYKKLYDLTEIPDRRNIRAPCAPRSPNVERMPIRPWIKCVDTPQLINCHTVLNEKLVEKSSVEPISTVDTTKKVVNIVPSPSLEKSSTAPDVKNTQSKNNAKTSKNQRKKMSKICTRDVMSKDSLQVENTTSENNTNFSDKHSSLKSQSSAKSRIKFVKLYEITEIPDRSNIRARYAIRSPNVQETQTSLPEKSVDKPKLISINTDLKKNAVDESSVEPIDPVGGTKKEPITTTPMEKSTANTDVKTEKSEIAATKISKNQRKKMFKMSSQGGISKESITVKNVSENKTNFSDVPKNLDSKTWNSGKKRTKFTKLYEITEIPEKHY